MVTTPAPREALETVGGVMTDLAEIPALIAGHPLEHVARILDRLSEEIAQAAAQVRAAAARG